MKIFGEDLLINKGMEGIGLVLIFVLVFDAYYTEKNNAYYMNFNVCG